MDSRTLAVRAMLKPPLVRTSALVALFTSIYESEDAWLDDPFEYRIVHRGADRFYVNDQKKLVRIELLDGEQVITPHVKVTVPAGWCANLPDGGDVYYGELMMNWIILVKPLGGRIPFQHGEFSFSKVEALIAPLVVDDHDTSATGIKGSHLELYYDACKYLETYAKIFNFSSSEVVMTQAPGTEALKAKLLAGKYKDMGNDLVKLLAFEKELHDHDDAYLATDRHAQVFVSGKMRNMARKKLFLSQGIEPSLGSKKAGDPITRSLQDGWDDTPAALADQMNVAVAASFSKGWSTRKAGYAGKVLIRAMNSFVIVKDDCLTTRGVTRKIDSYNQRMFIGLSVMDPGSTKWRTIANAADAKTLNGIYKTRSPAYCSLALPKICSECAGLYLSLNSARIGSASADVAAALLMLAMKAVHGVSPKTVDYQISDAIY